ncbi:sulfotransferase family 2 domain-containing protein [Acaryochloris sp. IP29b_bin.137]|uniref:sulfotransferase family 2 domain-containing protein n=1 Tax=Acaryochloris sp. IP29b_bin.137 TaxID=2969217 RepID=UPI00261D9B11|nr:sulfotransferase family 2 domain-containing protein [Acaryochloris sp. IP29b_bin.137]
MIINHKYKFIFLKTRKTAGTSIEIALSKFCDTHDVITPISQDDEVTRQEMGFPGPRNYCIALKYYSKRDWFKAIRKAERHKFYNHATAKYIQERIPAQIWNSYFKFTFERSPFDKAISRYYWSTVDPRPEISDYLNSVKTELLSNWSIYTINDQIAVDFVGRYETLDDDLAKIKDKLGLSGELNLPSAKSKSRKNREHYSRVLNSEARTRIEIVCAKEIAALGYRWSELVGLEKSRGA